MQELPECTTLQVTMAYKYTANKAVLLFIVVNPRLAFKYLRVVHNFVVDHFIDCACFYILGAIYM